MDMPKFKVSDYEIYNYQANNVRKVVTIVTDTNNPSVVCEICYNGNLKEDKLLAQFIVDKLNCVGV